MRSINKHQKTKYFVAIFFSMMLICGLAASVQGWFWFVDEEDKALTNNGATIDMSPGTESDNAEINAQKANGSIVPKEESDQGSEGAIEVVFTAANQDSPGGPLVVRVILVGASEGNCSFSLKRDDNIISYQTTVVNTGTYYSCGSLDIPVSQLSNGTWNLSVNVQSGNRSGIAQKEVKITL